jgi:hypothetical protein
MCRDGVERLEGREVEDLNRPVATGDEEVGWGVGIGKCGLVRLLGLFVPRQYDG